MNLCRKPCHCCVQSENVPKGDGSHPTKTIENFLHLSGTGPLDLGQNTPANTTKTLERAFRSLKSDCRYWTATLLPKSIRRMSVSQRSDPRQMMRQVAESEFRDDSSDDDSSHAPEESAPATNEIAEPKEFSAKAAARSTNCVGYVVLCLLLFLGGILSILTHFYVLGEQDENFEEGVRVTWCRLCFVYGRACHHHLTSFSLYIYNKVHCHGLWCAGCRRSQHGAHACFVEQPSTLVSFACR